MSKSFKVAQLGRKILLTETGETRCRRTKLSKNRINLISDLSNLNNSCGIQVEKHPEDS